MVFIKHVSLFIKKIVKELRAKWLSLPLLFLFPVLIISLIFIVMITFITPSEKEPIKIGLIDLDQSPETALIVEIIADSTDLGSFINIESMTEALAKEKMEHDELQVTVTFPIDFTANLYQGVPVDLAVVGHEKHPSESYLVNEIITSVTRLISAAQANILTINHYAKVLNLNPKLRSELLFEQFKEYLLFTLGKDKIIEQEKLVDYAASTPLNYYSLSAWFIISTMWLLIFYNFLFTENTVRIKQRIKLYGVTDLQEIVARAFVTLLIVSIFSLSTFIGLDKLLDLQLIREDFVRIAGLMCLYSIIFLVLLAITEVIIKSHKVRLLIQSIISFLLTIMSGAIIPVIYFPMSIQKVAPYIFSHHTVVWLQEVMLNDRYYVELTPLISTVLAMLFILIGLSFMKERLDL